ncbi:MAG TPA: hypothetical protein VMS76_00345, partial [Planctomycetota bacterium]|nr:hypothetical protein [Planctomycetota bacterium]
MDTDERGARSVGRPGEPPEVTLDEGTKCELLDRYCPRLHAFVQAQLGPSGRRGLQAASDVENEAMHTVRFNGERRSASSRSCPGYDTRLPNWRAALIVRAVAMGGILMSPLLGQTTIRVSVDDKAIQAFYTMGLYPDALSPDGRFALFRGVGLSLSAPYGYGIIRDLQLGVNDVFSRTYLGTASLGNLGLANTASAGGWFVAFSSNASDLVPGDNNYDWDVFLRDRLNGTTERISVDPWGNEVYGESDGAWISADGSRVAFVSWADGLVIGDNNGWLDVFVRDLASSTTIQVNLDSAGAQATYPYTAFCALCNPYQ